MDKGMVRVLGRTEQEGARLHHASQNDVHLKLINYFWNFAFNIILVDHSTWNHGKRNCRKQSHRQEGTAIPVLLLVKLLQLIPSQSSCLWAPASQGHIHTANSELSEARMDGPHHSNLINNLRWLLQSEVQILWYGLLCNSVSPELSLLCLPTEPYALIALQYLSFLKRAELHGFVQLLSNAPPHSACGPFTQFPRLKQVLLILWNYL